MTPDPETQKDLAGRQHWNQVYADVGTAGSVSAGWRPTGYDERTLEHILMTEIVRYRPKSLLEVGCGNSIWLAYLAHRTGVTVAGMDYSQQGCDLVRQRLIAEGVEGQIFCADLFQTDPATVGQYDFVFSLGLVEHFTDLDNVLSKLLEFVAPDGVLWTEVPNMRSIHGVMSWVWQPEQLAKHQIITLKHLKTAYDRLGLKEIHGSYNGLFSLNVPAWPYNPRWPKLAPRVVPRIYRTIHLVDKAMCRIKTYRGVAPLAPFLYIAGQRPEE
jgi:2-polyprenyl-6-hydroxyphenyl methylase/3-demethylubiquinone-9 3-methyltransferase